MEINIFQIMIPGNGFNCKIIAENHDEAHQIAENLYFKATGHYFPSKSKVLVKILPKISILKVVFSAN